METLLSPSRVTSTGTRTLRHFITGISPLSHDITPFLDMTLCPFVQPIVNTLTGKAAGIEVLLRLRDKVGRCHSTEPIIEMLESTSQMNDITAALITEISYNLQPIALEMPANFFITFNVSATQVSDSRLKRAVRHFVEVLSPRIPILLDVN
jgi:EAL domain-containing protein (putative c-di-GMP-specific phosphodiesterase class I)